MWLQSGRSESVFVCVCVRLCVIRADLPGFESPCRNMGILTGTGVPLRTVSACSIRGWKRNFSSLGDKQQTAEADSVIVWIGDRLEEY